MRNWLVEGGSRGIVAAAFNLKGDSSEDGGVGRVYLGRFLWVMRGSVARVFAGYAAM